MFPLCIAVCVCVGASVCVQKLFMGLQRVLAVINFSPSLFHCLHHHLGFSFCIYFCFYCMSSVYVCGSACVCVCACHVGVQYYYANYLFDISIEITMHLARLLCLRCVLLKQCLKLWKLNRNSMVCFWILFKISTFNMS